MQAAETNGEPVEACVVQRDRPLTQAVREHIAQCLGWQEKPSLLCHGDYTPLMGVSLEDAETVRLIADQASFYSQGKSHLRGHVEVQQGQRQVSAQTATIYRDANSKQITQIELLGDVHFSEPDHLMIAHRALLNPQDKSGQVEDVVYRFSMPHAFAVLPAWGRASLIQRLSNRDYFLKKATYTTCRPQDRAWHIDAKSIKLDNAHHQGVAKHAKFYLAETPVFYTPYLSFPTSKERKSGFLMPTKGYSNIGGFDYALPYYWNIAPNVDATLTPHYYTLRGVMLGEELRYLTQKSSGTVKSTFLPGDKAYNHFLESNEAAFPELSGKNASRWSFGVDEATRLLPNLNFHVNYQQVSDNYYLQDFTSNLSLLTERQLLQQGDLTYNTDHWLLRGMLQAYQTLQPINETPVGSIYQRLPQLMANGFYDDLPFHANLALLGQYDQFHMPGSPTLTIPEGPRYFLNPRFSIPNLKSWGYLTPGVELAQNFYTIKNYSVNTSQMNFSRTIPRYSLDSGLYFDRQATVFKRAFTQTLEPRLYYLNVPFHDQTPIPVYDSAYMIFNADQLFRTNRFSGFDRIGDANQLAYAMTSRWLSEETGFEKASVAVGQIYYFADRKVQLCQNTAGGTCADNPLMLGYLSPLAQTSPIAARAMYHFNPLWALTTDYVWDTYTKSTNNGHVDVRYQAETNHLMSLGYTYFVNADLTAVANSAHTITPQQDNPLHQASVSAAWPLNDHWSGVGSYNYNISKRYEMMTFLGVQYDSCCWAMRLLGGKTFQSLDTQLQPQYNNNVSLQILWKGLGSVGNSDPATIIHTYLPGYLDKFH